MRDEEHIETAKKALNKRIEEQEGLMLAFNLPKRDVITAVSNGDAQPSDILDTMQQRLLGNLELIEYVQAQAAINAAAWCQGELDSI